MIVSVRESKARLSELVAKASQGEDVLITVRGKPTVRLVPAATAPGKRDRSAWIAARRKQLARQTLNTTKDSATEIIDDLREERW